MYNIEFYENSTGTSELWDFMEELRQKQNPARMPAYN